MRWRHKHRVLRDKLVRRRFRRQTREQARKKVKGNKAKKDAQRVRDMTVVLSKSNVMKKGGHLVHLFDADFEYEAKKYKKWLKLRSIGLERIKKRFKVMLSQGLDHPWKIKVKNMRGEIRVTIYKTSGAQKTVVCFYFEIFFDFSFFLCFPS